MKQMWQLRRSLLRAGRREVGAWVALFRHGALLQRSGLLRFRLETFGVYYPSPPYTAPGWRLRPVYTFMLLRQARAYGHWLLELNAIQWEGPVGWWKQQGISWEGSARD